MTMNNPLKSPRKAGVEIIYKYDTNTHFRFDHRDGSCDPCSQLGDPLGKFLPGLTGTASTKIRKEKGKLPDCIPAYDPSA